MTDPDDRTVQDHLTLRFPMKSAADCAAAREKIPALVADLYRGADATGIIHYCRFIELDGTIYLLADYDGELETVLAAMAKHLGAVFEPLLALGGEPPPMPLADNTAAFVKWASAHCLKYMLEYSALPGVSVQKIKATAAAAGIELEPYSGQQLALLPIMPMKGRLAVLAIGGVFALLKGLLTKGADGVGTVHFVHLVEFPGLKIGFFTVYDGPWDKYLQDFAENMGPAFDTLFRTTKTSPPFPTSRHAAEFSKWVFDHELKPLAFYAAYPGLQVQDMKALFANG